MYSHVLFLWIRIQSQLCMNTIAHTNESCKHIHHTYVYTHTHICVYKMHTYSHDLLVWIRVYIYIHTYLTTYFLRERVNTCVYIYIYVYIYIRMYMCVYAYERMGIYTDVYVGKCMQIHTLSPISLSLSPISLSPSQAHKHTNTQVFVYAYTHICTRMYNTYTHKCIDKCMLTYTNTKILINTLFLYKYIHTQTTHVHRCIDINIHT